MKRTGLLATWRVCGLACAQAAVALPLNRSIGEYRDTRWSTRENVAIGEISAIAQASDEFIWLSTKVVINAIMTAAHDYGASSEVRLPQGSREFTVDFAGLSLSMSEGVRYRYRLSGLDNDWQDIGAQHQALYTNLSSGNHMFRLVGANSDGEWSRKGAQVTIVIPPSFMQTKAFAALCVFASVALVGFLFWIRVRRVSSTLRERHEARLAERDRIARDLHDTLLQSTEGLILKVYTATQQLPLGDPTRAFLTRSVDQAEQLAVEGRQKLLGLRQHSPSRRELSQALATLGLELSADTPTTFSAVKKGRVRGMAAATWDEVFSIAREAINNAFKHAHADHIEATVTYGSSTLTVRIRDDGNGVPKEESLVSKPARFGLRVMRERAELLYADLAVDTGPDQGTIVTLVVPASVAYLRRSTVALDPWDDATLPLSRESENARLT